MNPRRWRRRCGRWSPSAVAGPERLRPRRTARSRSRRAERRPGAGQRDDPHTVAVDGAIAKAAEDAFAASYFDAQSVVEDVVIAAYLWCRDVRRRA